MQRATQPHTVIQCGMKAPETRQMYVAFTAAIQEITEWGNENTSYGIRLDHKFRSLRRASEKLHCNIRRRHRLRDFQYVLFCSALVALDALRPYRRIACSTGRLKRPLVHMGALLIASMVMKANRSESDGIHI